MRRTPLTRRTPLAARKALRRRTALASTSASQGKTPGPPSADLRTNEVARPGRKRCRETGFPAPVRLAVRIRAGNGDPEQAECEACSAWLGRHGGQVQHIVARGNGGSRLRNIITNAALLCGTSLTGCHGLCERRDPHMRAMGFWRKTTDEPSPVMLHGQDGGLLVWLTPAGGYEVARPGEAGEAA